MSSPREVKSGIPALDDVLQNIRLGDNVVWQVDHLDDYRYFTRPYIEQAIEDRRRLIYLRFAPHPPVIEVYPEVEVKEVDPGPGFDWFSGTVHRVIEEAGREAFYVFDNLSALAVEWATDEMLANFFQVTCPYLFELDTVAYFALTRGKHAHGAVARIRDTTQILLDVYRAESVMYVHPLKVWDRYSPEMFLPHRVSGETWQPVHHSGTAAAVQSKSRGGLLRPVSESIAPWESVHRRLMQYRELAREVPDMMPEIAALKQELARMLVGPHPQFGDLADRYLSLHDLFDIRDRLIGSGRIGGKAAGMLVARAVLRKDADHAGFAAVMESHDSFYVGSDVFFSFLILNNLFRLRLHLSRTSRLGHDEFAEVEKRFLEGTFPPEILEQFRNLLEYFGQAPIIVRSSSLLEDSFGNAFAGKYRSEFCVNQGTPEERLEAFLRAVKLVYASALHPDALSYRRRRGLGERDEQMAILVQRVSGTRYRKYFFPALAGVAFSKNLYAWNDRIDFEKGMLRMVFGLGTRAVDRVGGDYPRMVAVSHPELRPEVGQEIAIYSQHWVDVLNLETNLLESLPLAEVAREKDYPGLHLLVSELKDGHVADPYSTHLGAPADHLVLTFNNLVRRTDLVRTIGEMVAVLEQAYGHPVDTEFTASIDAQGNVHVNLLQCRPLLLPGATGEVRIPDSIPRTRVLFRATRTVCGGVVRHIGYIVYIDPAWYAAIDDLTVKRQVGRLVGRINNHPAVSERKALLMGPGRWGSGNLDLGVNVGYGDIDNAVVLVELAREEHGHVPEVSYGTHFFQDLVEDQVVYLPVYPDDPATEFNHEFFERAPNVLLHLLPDAAGFERIVKVMDCGGASLTVLANPSRQQAVCYLE